MRYERNLSYVRDLIAEYSGTTMRTRKADESHEIDVRFEDMFDAVRFASWALKEVGVRVVYVTSETTHEFTEPTEITVTLDMTI